jgi:hypothetical protein
VADYERSRSESGKLRLKKTSGVSQDIKDIVAGVAQLVSPSALKERGNKIDDAVEGRKRQSTDHDY